MFNFTPDDNQQSSLEVPYIEDARADMARLYASNKTIKQATKEIERSLMKLDAVVIALQSGKFEVNGQTRIGYVLRFQWRGIEGYFSIAGLPIRNHTNARERQVRVQALLNIASWLETSWSMQVFSPNSMPLMQYLLAADGSRIIDHMLNSGALPALTASQDDIVEGEISE